ncbi:MAG: glucosyltransferase domain-containing protein, partial [Gemmiger sp.]
MVNQAGISRRQDRKRTSVYKSPMLWLALAVCVALGYGYAIAVPAVGVDDLAIEVYQQGGGFLRQSRITVWLLQSLTGLMAWQPHWPELFAALCLLLTGLLLAAVLCSVAGQPPSAVDTLLLAGGLLLYPFHAELLAYSNQCGIGFAMLLAVGALAAVRQHLFTGGGLPGAAAACVLLAFSVGYYESMAQLWLTLVMVLLLASAAAAPRRSMRWSWAVPAVLRGIWPLAGGLILRAVLTGFFCALTGTVGRDGAAAKTIYWFRRESPAQALRIFVREFLGNYLALPFGVPALALLVLACAALVLWAAVRRHGNGCGLLTAGLLVSIFSMGILQGTGSQMARASQCFAVFVPFVVWLLLRGRRGGLAVAVCALLLAVECFSLAKTFRVDRARWQYEEALLRQTAARLDALDPDGALPVVFSGLDILGAWYNML